MNESSNAGLWSFIYMYRDDYVHQIEKLIAAFHFVMVIHKKFKVNIQAQISEYFPWYMRYSDGTKDYLTVTYTNGSVSIKCEFAITQSQILLLMDINGLGKEIQLDSDYYMYNNDLMDAKISHLMALFKNSFNFLGI